MKYKLATFTKFIIVRHPFERLLSAYRNKVEGPKRTRYQGSPFRYVKKYRSNATQTDITWPEFVTYLINGGYVRNNHWRPYGTRCHLCAIDYDIIAKYETLVKDSEEFLRRVGAPESLHYPEYHPSSTKDILESYMKKLTKEQIDRLYHTYKQDFILFQYTYNTQ
ncbi:carbohydrate sulfotransferase 11-like [Homarus americanus]|uniref:carbohydrate sulfotransferase 11-like n=1 Tax=Homarus americanus TaxID=6706 RepID=UPI001C484183|nr:carbohydrate sulfotransferase 11-like [Homarus americanus]